MNQSKNFNQNHNTKLDGLVPDETNFPANCKVQLSLFEQDERSPSPSEAIWYTSCCPHCGWNRAVERLFNGNTHHSGLRCERCGRHLRWVKRSDSKLSTKGGAS